MKIKFTSAYFICALVGNYVTGQTILNTPNIPTPGLVCPSKQILNNNLSPGNAGANQIWYFPDNVNPTISVQNYVSPSGTVNDQLFPVANLKVNSHFGGDEYYIYSTNSLQFLGLKNNSFEIIINNPQAVLTVPMHFGDSITNVPVSGIGLGYPIEGTISVKADASGDLQLTTGSFTGTLRVMTDINLVQAPNTGLDTEIKLKKYSWFTSNYRVPVFEMSILTINGVLGNVNQQINTVSMLTTGIEDADPTLKSVSVFPNPSTDVAEINIHSDKNKEGILKVQTREGKVLYETAISIKAGLNNIPVNVSGFLSGTYFVEIISGSDFIVKHIVVN